MAGVKRRTTGQISGENVVIEVAWMYYQEGLNQKDIADRLGIILAQHGLAQTIGHVRHTDASTEGQQAEQYHAIFESFEHWIVIVQEGKVHDKKTANPRPLFLSNCHIIDQANKIFNPGANAAPTITGK